MPPIIRIRLSPTTTTPSAETCWPMPAMLDTVRKAGLTTEPTTSRMTSTGSSATSRSTLMLTPRRRRGPAPARGRAAAGGRRVGRAGGQRRVGCRSGDHRAASSGPPVPASTRPSVATISASRSNGGSVNSVKTSPRTSTTMRSHKTRSDSSSLHSRTPAPVPRATVGQRPQQQRLRRDVHAARGRDRDHDGRVVGQRAGDRRLLLVAAGQLADRLGRPGRDQGQRRR